MFIKIGAPEKIEKVEPVSKQAFKKTAKCSCGNEFIVEGGWASDPLSCPKCGDVVYA